METSFPNHPKPTLVNVIAWTTLASGIVNIFWGLIASFTVLATIVGVICTPFTILPTILGIFEVIYAAKLLSNPPQTVQPSTAIAILEILCILAFNVFSVVVGILSLVFYNDVAVRDYFASLNGSLAPAAPAPVIPASGLAPVEDVLPDTPVMPEEITPVPEETPEKPKRSRKVAGE